MNSTIYLDLGSALAAFGLIFTVYQLRKPQWDVVLRLRSRFQRNLIWIFGCLGLFLALFRVLIAQNEHLILELAYPLNKPLTYEIMAYLFFIVSPLSLMLLSTRPKKLFKIGKARRFCEVMVQEISRTNDEGTSAALEILLHNFREVCKVAKKPGDNNEAGAAARSILDVILSDQSVVKILTTKRLDALLFILEVIEKDGITRRESHYRTLSGRALRDVVPNGQKGKG